MFDNMNLNVKDKILSLNQRRKIPPMNKKSSSFSESAKTKHGFDYCLSLTQHSESESNESFKVIENPTSDKLKG